MSVCPIKLLILPASEANKGTWRTLPSTSWFLKTHMYAYRRFEGHSGKNQGTVPFRRLCKGYNLRNKAVRQTLTQLSRVCSRDPHVGEAASTPACWIRATGWNSNLLSCSMRVLGSLGLCINGEGGMQSPSVSPTWHRLKPSGMHWVPEAALAPLVTTFSLSYVHLCGWTPPPTHTHTLNLELQLSKSPPCYFPWHLWCGIQHVGGDGDLFYGGDLFTGGGGSVK